MTVCFSRTRIPKRATLAHSAVLPQHIGSSPVPGAARLGVSFQAIMRFSRRDAILYNLRLRVIRSRFTDLSATRARESFRSVKSTFLGARLWVLVCGCSILRMIYISKASTEILCGGDLPAHFDMLLPRVTNPESLRLIFVLSKRSKIKRKSIEKTPAMCESAVALANARAVTVACWYGREHRGGSGSVGSTLAEIQEVCR